MKETIPFFLNKFEQTIGKNGGYAVGTSVSCFFFHCDGALKGIYGCGLYCKLLIIGETGFDFTRFEILLDLFT